MSVSDFNLEVREDPAHHVDFSARSTGLAIVGFSVILFGWALAETTGSAAAAVDIYDAPAATGIASFPVKLASGEFATAWFSGQGILFLNGVYLNPTSGSVAGSVFYRHHMPT